MELVACDGAAVTIALESAADVAARDALLDRAMSANWRKKASNRLRNGRLPAEGLAFVAHDGEGRLVGTVRLWHVHAGVDTVGAPVPALLLGPLAVDPETKSAGIGSALMKHAISEAARLGHGAILLVGDAAYYERFGYSAGGAKHLVMPGPFERSRFLALELRTGWLDGAAGVLVASGERRLAKRQTRLAA